MKILTRFKPANSSDTSVTITASSENANFPVSNLKTIQPVRSWKSTVITESWVKYDFNSIAAHANFAFINRFNFAAFKLQRSNDNGTWTDIQSLTGLTVDEIADETYMHIGIDIGALTYRYLRILISTQTPLFEPLSFKIGNFLVGNVVDIWNPKAGFNIPILPKMSITEFRSGYISAEKLGRTRRAFNGTFDKITKTEHDKIVKTYQPFVLLLDFDNEPTSVYLVRSVREFVREYYMSNIISLGFSFEEIV